jgi:hypothetical protein
VHAFACHTHSHRMPGTSLNARRPTAARIQYSRMPHWRARVTTVIAACCDHPAIARACDANHERWRTVQIRPAIKMPPGRRSASAAQSPISRADRLRRPIESIRNRAMEAYRSMYFAHSVYESYALPTIGHREIQRFVRVNEWRRERRRPCTRNGRFLRRKRSVQRLWIAPSAARP